VGVEIWSSPCRPRSTGSENAAWRCISDSTRC
jgi:hypothetical protein